MGSFDCSEVSPVLRFAGVSLLSRKCEREIPTSFLNMPTYSEDDLTTALAACCNKGHTSIRKYAYTFNILPSTLSN